MKEFKAVIHVPEFTLVERFEADDENEAYAEALVLMDREVGMVKRIHLEEITWEEPTISGR